MRFRYDKSSKWLLDHHGDSILRLGGVTGIRSWRALAADLVQPRQLPDGLIEARLEGRPGPDLFLIELSTYPDNRVPGELLDDLLLTYLDRRQVPEVLTLVLHPKGNLEVAREAERQSPLGWTRLHTSWRVVELWTLPAAPLLAAEDPGLAPWVPLTSFSDPPEVVLRQCREVIDRKAKPDEHGNLLVVSTILAGLRYDDTTLLSILGGREAMIESPVLQRLLAEERAKARHNSILTFLRARFTIVSPDIEAALQGVLEEQQLDDLAAWAAQCPNLDAFKTRLPSAG